MTRRFTKKRKADKSSKIISIAAQPRSSDQARTVTFKYEYTNDDGVKKTRIVNVPQIQNNYTPIELFQIFTEFDEARESQEMDEGRELFNNFRSLCVPSRKALTEWKNQCDGLQGQRTVEQFEDAYDAFKIEMLQNLLDYHDQLDYLRDVRKPGPMTVEDFKKKLEELNALVAFFPDAPEDDPGLTENEMARAFHEAMPVSWQEKYADAGYKYNEEDIEDVYAYMCIRENRDPYESKEDSTAKSDGKSNDNNGGDRNNNDRNNRDRNNNDRNNRNRRSRNQRGRRNNDRYNGGSNSGSSNGNNSNNGNGNNNSNRRIRPEDPCPLPGHGNHPWYDCFNNAHGRHGDNSRRPANANGNASGESNSNEGEQHFLDTADAPYCRPCNQSNNFGYLFDTNDDESPEVFLSEIVEHDDDDEPPPLLTRAEAQLLEDDDDDSDDEESVTLPPTFDTPTIRSGPLALSEGAIEIFEFESLINDGVDSALDPLTLVPTTLAAARAINGRSTRNATLRTLLDHGASHSLINKRCLPQRTKPTEAKSISFSTTAGKFSAHSFVTLEDFRLPEFNRNRSVENVKCSVLDNASVKYDLILGRDFLNHVGIDVKSSNLTCEWCGDAIPFKPPSYINNDAAHAALRESHDESTNIAEYESHAVTYTATKSTFADIEDVVAEQKHLTPKQQEMLLEVLQRHAKLFNGKLGCYPHRKFHIELKPGTKPYHCKAPYPIPAKMRPTVKGELDRQVKEDILERVNESKWGMPMLCIPKKDGAIRTVDDVRELNKCIQRRIYPLPRMMDMLRRHRKWRYLTLLDITLCYYTYELDEESSWLCVLVTPFGKYRRKRLSMGLAQSPDWAQAALEEVLQEFLHDFVEAFIDDVAIFSETWEEHVVNVGRVLTQLEKNGYTVNPAKCRWGVAEAEWMGHFLTKDGLKPWPKKVEGIVNIAQPQTLKQLRAFIGMVNFYRDFWKQRAHVMAPLTALTKVPRKEFLKHWTEKHTAAFKATKAMIAQDVLLAFPDPNKKFVIETDASDYQLGAIGRQEGRPIFMWSRKLTKAQQNYATPDKEAACIVEVLQVFRNMLYGCEIEVHTDHMNLTRSNLNSLRLLRWRLAMEEFAPTIIYKPGKENIVADGLSRLPLTPPEEQGDPVWNHDLLGETMLYYPEAIDTFPLEFGNLVQAQADDATIQAKVEDGTYVIAEFGDHLLATKLVDAENRIVVPESLHDSTIHWYHYILGHCGQERLIKSIRNHLFFPGLEAKVKAFVETCDECQRYKNNGPAYGYLPPRDDDPPPFDTVALDHVGPWTITVPNTGKITFHGLTIIDLATNLLEIVRVDNLDSETTTLHFENTWLSRYPRPSRCLFDAAGAFHHAAFQLCLNREGITPVPITVKNPQANAIVERSHLTMGNMLRTLQASNVPDNVETAYEIIDTAFASVQRAMRTAVHKTLGLSSGSMVFHRDMLLNIPTIVDLQLIADRRRAVADRNNEAENRRRRYKNYNIGDEVLILAYKPHKLGMRAIGPFTVIQVHVNGTVTIQRRPNVTERISIRRLKPYNRRT